jgi:hypothetical protein
MSEAAKRARLERLVRPLKRAVCRWIRGGIKLPDSKDLSPSGGITGLSYAEAWAEMAQVKRGFQAEPTKIALCLKTIFCGLTPELSRDAQRPSGVLHDSATSEAAKRSRLERIVRAQRAIFWQRPDMPVHL